MVIWRSGGSRRNHSVEGFLHEWAGNVELCLLVGGLAAAACAVLSCFLVLRGWALLGDAISHAVLPGIVLAYWLRLPLGLGAFLSGLSCAVLTGYVKNTSRVKEDTAMGVVFTGLFALGLVMQSRTASDLHLDHILFGHILGVTSAQLIETVVIAIPVLVLSWLGRRDFLLAGFDPAHFRSLGGRVKLWHYYLLIMVALAIVTALKSLGLILVVAFLITPGATAHLLVRRLDAMIALAVLIAVSSVIGGLWLAMIYDASASASIVLCLSAFFIVAVLFSPRSGWVWRRGVSASV
jgi:manganese/iron transport system permease protein